MNHQSDINIPPANSERYANHSRQRQLRSTGLRYGKVYNNNEANQLIYGEQDDGLFQIQDGKLSPIISRQTQIRRNKSDFGARNWKTFIHPEISKYYDQIMGRKNRKQSQKQFRTPKVRHNTEYSRQQQQNDQGQEFQQKYRTPKSQKSTVGNQPTKHTKSSNVNHYGTNTQNDTQTHNSKTYDEIRKKYEDKISVLQHQNNNLKDQLFYLRAAILAKYEQRQQQGPRSPKYA